MDGKAQARTVGGDKFAIEIAGPFSKGATPAVVKDNCDGTYDVTWHTDAAGNYLINAKLDGFAVGGCPVHCTGVAPYLCLGVPQAAKHTNKLCRHSPLERIGTSAPQGIDNPMHHEVPLICTVAWQAGVSHAKHIRVRRVVCILLCEVVINHRRVALAVNAAPMEGSKCTATGDGLSRARAGLPASFQIKAADLFGNRRSTGWLAPSVLVLVDCHAAW